MVRCVGPGRQRWRLTQLSWHRRRDHGKMSDGAVEGARGGGGVLEGVRAGSDGGARGGWGGGL
jgi:hypothetical protein